MTSLLILLSTVCCILFGFGCGEKQQSVEMFPKEGQATQAANEIAAIATPAITPPASSQTQTQAQVTSVVSPTPISEAGSTAQSTPVLPAESMERTRMVQTVLKNLNLYSGAIDGKVGPLTEQAIKSFQSSRNLKVDGKVGPLTWAELSKSLPESNASSSEGVQQ